MPPRLPLELASAKPLLSRVLSPWACRRAAPATIRSNSSASSTGQLANVERRQHGGGGRHHPGRPAAGAFNPMGAAERMVHRFKKRSGTAKLVNQMRYEKMSKHKESADYLRQMTRRFAPGDVYSPHDLSSAEMVKWRGKGRRVVDVVDVLGLRPLDMYKNFSLISDFTNSSGQIVNTAISALRPVNQRKIAKMIRRAQGMGLYPTIHDHPELIRPHFMQIRTEQSPKKGAKERADSEEAAGGQTR